MNCSATKRSMKNNNKPAGHSYTMFKQICKLIPGHLVDRLAKEHGVDEQARTFSPWSHVVSLVYSQTVHATGLNDVCDGLRMHGDALSTIRGATAPSKNNRIFRHFCGHPLQVVVA